MILSIDSNDANTAPLHKKTISSLSGAVESMMKKLEDVGVLVARILMPILFLPLAGEKLLATRVPNNIWKQWASRVLCCRW